MGIADEHLKAAVAPQRYTFQEFKQFALAGDWPPPGSIIVLHERELAQYGRFRMAMPMSPRVPDGIRGEIIWSDNMTPDELKAHLSMPTENAGAVFEDTCLDRAKAITQERGVQYGHPAAVYSIFAGLLRSAFGHDFTTPEAVMVNVLLKVARELSTHNRDNVDDIAGYAWVLEAVQKKEGSW